MTYNLNAFAVLKRDLENAITNLEQRQKLLEDAIQTQWNINRNECTDNISDNTTTVRPISIWTS